jgi:peptidoglycan-associated lipoprotein
MLTFRGALIVTLTSAACHHATPATTPTQPPADPGPSAAASISPPPQAVSTNLSASDDLVRQCQLHFDNKVEAPKFNFDNFELTTTDRDVLQQIATCVTSGPLSGRKLALVGRADPRGTEEYNLGLGDKRAHSVDEYLLRLGVNGHAIGSSTRGALDASGNDESSWRVDRRVDLELN